MAQPWDMFWQEVAGNVTVVVLLCCSLSIVTGWRDYRRQGCRRRHPATKSHYYKARKGN